MTKIQIRRDTSSNWQQYNPTPSSGEPCYETDTGKFKIGNGEQPYNQLEYIGDGGEAYTLPPATVDTLGGIKVGNNLSITTDGTLSATSSTPSNMMTTDTNQSITGDKTFTAHDIILYATEASTLAKIRGRYSIGIRDIINPTGSTYSGPCFGDTARVTRLESSPDIGVEVVADGDTPSTTSALGRLIHTGNMLGCITAGDNITITETGTGRNRQMIISSTGALKYWTGTEAEYTAISTKDPDTLYRTTDTNKVFLGTIQLGG